MKIIQLRKALPAIGLLALAWPAVSPALTLGNTHGANATSASAIELVANHDRGGGGGGRGGGGGGGGGGARAMSGGGGGGGNHMRSGGGGGGGPTMSHSSRSSSGGGADRVMRSGRRDRGSMHSDRGDRGSHVVTTDRNRGGGSVEHRRGGDRDYRRGHRYAWGPGIDFWFWDGYYYGDCSWLRQRAVATGSRIWWRRYRLCREAW